MAVYVGLLRAVNVGGTTPVGMESLRDLLAKMGFERVRSVLQSGNVVFESGEADATRLERRIEERLATEFRLRTDLFLRGAAEWNSIVRENPFSREAADDPGRLVVTVLKTAAAKERFAELEAAIVGRERVSGAGRHAYIVYPDGQGRSRLTLGVIEKHLATRGTSRNWNTVTKLAALVSGAPESVGTPH